jgi:signal transduction histidine kinase
LLRVLTLVIGSHEKRTGVSVRSGLTNCAQAASQFHHSTAICAYRFVQEGLNAVRHGPGFDPADIDARGLGLAGLRERVESIGG